VFVCVCMCECVCALLDTRAHLFWAVRILLLACHSRDFHLTYCQDFGPPEHVVEAGTYSHACEGEAVCKLTNEKVLTVASLLP
jgi:hypothetical protein